MGNLFGTTVSFLLSGSVVVLLGAGLWGIHRRLLKAYANKPAEQYRRQLIMLGLSLFGLVFAIVIIPIGDAMQGQLLGLLGIVLSATIALSSTTLVGNAMAGLMLKSLKKVRPGNYILVEGHAGRVSEMDLLHTEIQTEERDLTTLPNLFLVTNPVTVLRSSGTILSVEVSLGYDVPRRRTGRHRIRQGAAGGIAGQIAREPRRGSRENRDAQGRGQGIQGTRQRRMSRRTKHARNGAEETRPARKTYHCGRSADFRRLKPPIV